MKPFLRLAIFSMCIIFFLFAVTSCSASKSEKDTKKTTVAKSTAQSKESKKEVKKATSTINPDLAAKKIVIINDVVSDTTKAAVETMKKTYTKKGITEKNIITFEYQDTVTNVGELIGKVKGINPDIINLIIGVPNPLRFGLASLGIPIVVGSVGEMDCDENGVPKANVTGFRSIPANVTDNLCKMVNDISPFKGKKAAFLSHADARQFNENMIKKSLAKIGVELKEFVGLTTDQTLNERAIEAAKRLSNDPEIGCVFIGVLPVISDINATENGKKIIAAITKPTASFYEGTVAQGALCGISIDDTKGFGLEPAQMGLKILEGANIKDIKLADHKYTNIILNKKTSENLKVTIPDNIFQSAFRIYTDFDNHYVGAK